MYQSFTTTTLCTLLWAFSEYSFHLQPGDDTPDLGSGQLPEDPIIETPVDPNEHLEATTEFINFDPELPNTGVFKASNVDEPIDPNELELVLSEAVTTTPVPTATEPVVNIPGSVVTGGLELPPELFGMPGEKGEQGDKGDTGEPGPSGIGEFVNAIPYTQTFIIDSFCEIVVETK